MKILTIVIIFLFFIALAVSFVLAKKLSSPKYQKSNIEMSCTIFTTIITPVLTVLSVILVIYTVLPKVNLDFFIKANKVV